MIAIVGSREISERTKQYVREFVRGLWILGTNEIVTGSARGVDTAAEEEAQVLGMKVKTHVPDYFRFGKVAPLIRNELIINDCDELIAFWDGKSKGTKYTIGRAQLKGVPVTVVNIPASQGDE